MRVLITGGSGLIGRALVDELLAFEHRPVVLSRRPDRVKGLPEGSEKERWDGADAGKLAALLEGADAVVHLAGESIASGRWTSQRKRRIRDSRVRSSRALAAAFEIAGARPGVLVQGSAVGYYGSRGDEEIDEGSTAGGGFLAEVCQEWEAASAGVEPLGVRRVVVRTGVVLSTEGGALPRIALPFKLFAGGRTGDGNQWVPWIHLADEAAGIRFLVETAAADGIYNLTAPRPVTNAELSRRLGEALGRPSFMPAPAFALRLALGEMAQLVMEGQRVLPRRLQEAGFEFQFGRLEDALADLYD